jgi:adenylate cyclase
MGTEIERKFLVDGALSFDGPGRVMQQGYIALDPTDGTEVRLRREAGLNTLAIKRGGGLVRHETEIDIDDDTADGLWALTEGRRVEKCRYLRIDRGVRVEIDVYGGTLSGLVVAEVEFETEESARAFEPFDWLGEEISGNPRYRNNVLARLGRVPDEGELEG